MLLVTLGRVMFECGICGLLSLNAISCPACGSQNLRDLSESEVDASDLPTEIPGLDDAVESWREIEGDDDQALNGPAKRTNNGSGALPFGYSGESNLQVSRLPFGIGSQAEGIPFDSDVTESDDSVDQYATTQEAKPEGLDANLTDEMSSVNPEFSPNNSLVEVIVKRPNPIRIQPLPDDYTEPSFASKTDDLSAEFELPPNNVDDIPEEWRISASEVDMAAIYSTEQEFVQVVHQPEEDVVIFDHSASQSVVASELVFDDDVTILSLELHPARALDVDVSKNPECREDLDAGYFAIAKNSWSEAAIKFQKVAARMHGNSAVYNNYGLSLLQRAIEMAKDSDESTQMLATSQFESAILALREAAKSDPDEPVVLLNLAHALLVSGRSEKALKVVEVHNEKYPNSVEGVNLEAATLVSLGQSVNAKAKLSQYRGDAIVDENLARLL